MKCSLGISNYLEEISSLSHSVFFPPFLCIDRWGRLSYLSLLFWGTLHSNGYIFPFLLCFSLPFFSQLFVRPPLTAILPFCISFFNMCNVFIHKILFSSQLVSLGNVPLSQIPWVHHIIMLFFSTVCIKQGLQNLLSATLKGWNTGMQRKE